MAAKKKVETGAGGVQPVQANAQSAPRHQHTHSLTLIVEDDAGDRVPHAEVRLTRKDPLAGQAEPQPQETDSQGKAYWPDLEEGTYGIAVTVGKNLTACTPTSVTLEDDDLTETLKLAGVTTVHVHAFETYTTPEGKPSQRDLAGVVCHLYRDGKRAACDTTDNEGKAMFVGQDLTSGEYTLEVPHIHRIKREVQGETESLRTLQSSLQGRLHFLAEAGEKLTLEIPYTAACGELQVNTVLLYDKEDGERDQADMSGVVLALYQDGRAIQTLTTTGTAPTVFSGLTDKRYTLRVVRTPEVNGGTVEPLDPPGGILTFQIGAGQTLKRDLTFELASGTVLGKVYAAGLEDGLEGISLVLIDTEHGIRPITTGPHGEIHEKKVPPGTYTLQLAQDKVASADGQRWELAPGTPAQRTVVVRAGRPSATLPFVLVREEHVLEVDVLGADGQPVPYAQVTVRDERGNDVGTGFATDAHGHVTIHLDQEGIYQVGLQVDQSGNPVLAPQIVSVHSKANTVLRLRGTASAAPAQPSGPTQAIVDIPYPLLAETVMAPSWSAGGAAPALPDPGRIVQSTLNEILGWKSRPYKVDGRGFVAALNQAFTVKEVQGHTEFTWIPRSYAVVQDMGALTGAQASIYNRAKVALDQALPLLDGLYPLRADADEQDVEAIRAIVRSGFTELVGELSLEGGPRVSRVDALFESLLGAHRNVDPEQVAGQLGELAGRFGLIRARVNTIEEEQNLTNYLIAVDYVIGLKQSWDVQRPFFTRGSGAQPYFGTQLVLVSRALAVISESVQEAYLAMDSVFLGPAERQVVELNFPGQPPMFVAELLSWVDDAASDEGPRLIQEGGKQGVVAFQPTLTRLARLVRGALVPPQNPNTLPAGYSTARVQRALQELADHLEEAAQLAGQLSRQPAEAQLYFSAGESPQLLLRPGNSVKPTSAEVQVAPPGTFPGDGGGSGAGFEPLAGTRGERRTGIQPAWAPGEWEPPVPREPQRPKLPDPWAMSDDFREEMLEKHRAQAGGPTPPIGLRIAEAAAKVPDFFKRRDFPG